MVIDARSYERQRGQERAGGAYARTYVRTYVKRTFVRMYVLFRLRTYARNGLRCGLCFTYVRTRTCVRTVSPATYVRTYVLFHLPRTYVLFHLLRTYVLFHLPTYATYVRARTYARSVQAMASQSSPFVSRLLGKRIFSLEAADRVGHLTYRAAQLLPLQPLAMGMSC